MNQLQDKINFVSIDDLLINDELVFKFRNSLPSDDSWIKVNAIMCGIFKSVYLKDFAFFWTNKFLTVTEDHVYLAALDYLKIKKEDYEINPLSVANCIFKGRSLKDKNVSYNNIIVNYQSNQERDHKQVSRELDILKNLIKKITIDYVSENGSNLFYALSELKNDIEVVLAAVKKNGWALQFASVELKNNIEVVLAAVKQNGLALQFASIDLKNNIEVILAAVRQNKLAINNISVTLKNDIHLFLSLVSIDGLILNSASKVFKNNYDIVLAAVKQNGLALNAASIELKDDKDVVMAAVKQNEYAVIAASLRLKNDEDILLSVVSRQGCLLYHASDELKNNRNIVLAAVSQQGDSIYHASDELKNDWRIALAAVCQNVSAFSFISTELQVNREFILSVLKINKLIVLYLPLDLITDKSFMLLILENNESVFGNLPDELKRSRKFVLEAANKNGNILKYASDYIKNDKEIVLAAVKQNGFVFFDASRSLKNDKEVVLAAVKQNGMVFEWLEEHFQNDIEIKTESLKQISFSLLKKINPSLNTYLIKLIDGYERLKDEKYSHNEVADRVVLAFIKNKDKQLIKMIEHIKKKLSKFSEGYHLYVINHLQIEAHCLKMLGLTNVENLRIICPLVKLITNYRNYEIRKYLFEIIKSFSGDSLKCFLEKLTTISKGKINLILPSIILSSLNISKETQEELHDVLNSKIDIFKDKTKPLLQSLIFLEKKLKDVICEVDHEKIALIVKEELVDRINCGAGLPNYTGNYIDIVERINLLLSILEIDLEIFKEIDSFSSFNLLTILVNSLVKIGVLENIHEDKIEFINVFMNSRRPYAIFTYINKFKNDKEMICLVRRFVLDVTRKSYLTSRHANNSHKHLLTEIQKSKWEEGFAEPLAPVGLKKYFFDARSFLKDKLIDYNHDNDKLYRVKMLVNAGIEISDPSEIESLCIEMLGKKSVVDYLDILKRLMIIFNSSKEYENIEFKNDIKDQLSLMLNSYEHTEILEIKDTEDWEDLFFCGTEVVGSCQRIDGMAKNNKFLLGYILDGKIRMIKISSKDGVTIARSIIKIMKNSCGNPVLFLEKSYPDDKYYLIIKEFAKKRSKYLGIDLYEYDPIGLTILKSEGNTASLEYEDSSNEHRTSGIYTVTAQLVV